MHVSGYEVRIDTMIGHVALWFLGVRLFTLGGHFHILCC